MFRPGRGRRDEPQASGAQLPEPAGAGQQHAGAVQTAAPVTDTGEPPASTSDPDAGPEAAGPQDRAGGGQVASGTAQAAVQASGAAQADPAADQASGAAQADPAADQASGAAQADPAAVQASGPAAPDRSRGQLGRLSRAPAWVSHVGLLLAYTAAGIGVTFPRIAYISRHRLPASPDVSSYIWALWWVPHQIAHLANPWFTTYMAAPVGTQLGFNTLMPLPAVLLWPVTAQYGPVASFTVLTLITPGLACYAMYRAARLWLNVPAAIAAGALFGLSSMLAWQNWYHINISLGTVFLPITLEAAIRLRRGPTIKRAVGLGLALAGSLLVNQESTILALMLTAAIMIPWLAGLAIKDRAALRTASLPLGVGALVAAVVASPQLIAMAQQAFSGGASVPVGEIAANSTQYGVGFPTLFAPSPRLASYGLSGLTTAYNYTSRNQRIEGIGTFGLVLTVLALLGVIAAWRQRSTWGFAGLWLGCAALALGPFLVIGKHAYYPWLSHLHWSWIQATGRNGVTIPAHWAPVSVSNLMPYTWLVRIPGLSGLREADRFALLGLVGAALLAGFAVQWLTKHARLAITVPVIVVVAGAATLEAGWPGTKGLPGSIAKMPVSMPWLSRPLGRDHSHSIVVDVPYGLRGGLNLVGSGISVRALLQATQDGHPRAVSYTSWVPKPTIRATLKHAFYAGLIEAEAGGGGRGLPTCADLRAQQARNPQVRDERCITAAQLRAAHADALRMHVGWIIVWLGIWQHASPKLRYKNVENYLQGVGFRFEWQHYAERLYRLESR